MGGSGEMVRSHARCRPQLGIDEFNSISSLLLRVLLLLVLTPPTPPLGGRYKLISNILKLMTISLSLLKDSFQMIIPPDGHLKFKLTT